jgi:uncharacterized protein YtpQ (UPF0354 family)
MRGASDQAGLPMARLIAALLLVLSVVASDAKPLSPAEFTREFTSALRAALPTSVVTVKSDLNLVIKNDDGTEAQAFLVNAYQDYVAGPPDGYQSVIRKYVAAIADQQRFRTAKIDRARLVPVIKDRGWLADSQDKLIGAKGLPVYVYEPYNDDLVILYAEDTPHNIRYVPPKELDAAGVARVDLRALATANLRRILPKLEVHSGPVVSMITAGGDYESSLLLLDEVWSTGQVPAGVAGDVVVAIPARDLLLFTGSRNSAGVARLREIAAKTVKTASHSLTDSLFVYRGGKFTRFGGD